MSIPSVCNNFSSQSRPLSVTFMVSTLVYGGAETLLDNLVRRLDRRRFDVAVCCTKTRGALGEQLAQEVPVYEYRMRRKWDVGILGWMKRLLRQRQTDVVVTVGAGDKMFWGRLASWREGVPVVISALHATGWPDSIGRLNRLLTPINDAFVGVAPSHGRYLIDVEQLPADKVHVIPNGIDTDKFRPQEANIELRASLGLPDGAPVAGIVARLGEEKNHEMFLRVARRIRDQLPAAHFLIVGDGPRRHALEALAHQLRIADCVHFTGVRSDVHDLLPLTDVLLLTSHIEANPVSVLEAMSSETPVIVTRVGSLAETVIDGQVGYLVSAGDEEAMSRRAMELLTSPDKRASQGRAGRRHVVDCWSIDEMVRGYERLMLRLYSDKFGKPTRVAKQPGGWNHDNAERLNRLADGQPEATNATQEISIGE